MKTCPACGSDSLNARAETWTYRAPFSSLKHLYNQNMLDCQTCHCMFLDETFENEATQAGVIAAANQRAMRTMLKALWQLGYKSVYMERVLQLPIGAMELWYRGHFDPAAFALVCVLNADPRVLEVMAAEISFQHDTEDKHE